MKYLTIAFLLLISSCVTRQEVEADIWQVGSRGVFRLVECTKQAEREGLCRVGGEGEEGYYGELVRWNRSEIKTFLAMRRADAEKWFTKLAEKGKSKSRSLVQFDVGHVPEDLEVVPSSFLDLDLAEAREAR